MKLSDGEKLMLLMLCDIYEKTDAGGEIEPRFVRDAILDDQLWAIDWQYSGLLFEKSDAPEQLPEVLDILDVWWLVEKAYRNLDDSDTQSLKKYLGRETLPKFTGFDGNNEIEYMIICQYLIEKLDRYSEFKGRDLNSHGRRLKDYRAMAAVFEPMKQRLSHHNLGLEQIRTILSAPYATHKCSSGKSEITQDFAL